MTDKSKSTKLYSFRLDIELVDKLREKADEQDLTLTQIVQRYLKSGLYTDSLPSEAPVHSNNFSKADLLQVLVKILAKPETQSQESSSSDSLKELTQEIEKLGQRMEQLEQRLTTT
jgi:antitoxin component of RelBE/YafQ-DinJ toxin-antitoxin module